MAAYKIADIEKMKLQVGAPVSESLYVYLSSADQYLQFLAQNEILTQAKFENIQKLKGKNIFVRNTGPGPTPEKNGLDGLSPEEIYKKDLLGEKTEKILKNLYLNLIKGPTGKDSLELSQKLTSLTENILETLVPQAKDQRDSLLKNLKNLPYMTHATAITSLAIVAAIANDFKSKTSIETLCKAAMLMDASLAEVEEAHLQTYYRNRSELPSHVFEKIKNHPLKSQQLVAYLPNSNELVNQIILGHHELHNGKGYHRGVKLGTLPALAHVMSFAVDLYETLKSAELNKNPMTLEAAIRKINERHLEPHLRRHSERIIKNVMVYLELSPNPAK